MTEELIQTKIAIQTTTNDSVDTLWNKITTDRIIFELFFTGTPLRKRHLPMVLFMALCWSGLRQPT